MKALLLFAALALAGGTAAAEPVNTPEERQQARAHFETGREAFRKGDYARAVDEFRAAYALHPDPEFHFNIAESFRRWGKPREALASYRQYLELDPSGRAAEMARASAEEIEQALEAEEARQAPPPPEPAPPPVVAAPPVEKPAAPAGAGRTLRWSGVAVGAAGAMFLGAGVYFGMLARSYESDLEGAREFDQATFDAGEKAERRMVITSAIGATAVATGAVLFVLGVRQARAAERDAHLSIAAHGDGLLIGAWGRF